jgi:hypothetical protein
MSSHPDDHLFTLRFEADGERFRVSAIGSAEGEARMELSPPCTAAELAALRRQWEEVVLAAAPRPQVDEPLPWGESALGDELDRLSDALTEALFPPPIRRLWDAARARARRDGAGLALRLSFDPGDPRTAFLASLPWELVGWQRPGRRELFALDPTVPLYRHLEVPEPARPVALRRPLGVLLVVAAPRDQPRLALDEEREAILRRWRRQPETSVDTLDHATLRGLGQALARGDHQIVHFLGHGAFDERCGRGALVLEDATGRSAVISDQAVAAQFRGRDHVALVVLNACEGARAPADALRPTFAGVATCLIDEGVPAVVAMQFPISDRAASAFGLGLHSALADGEDVARAVVAGRQAIRDDIPGTLQWITPALFLRQPPVAEREVAEADSDRFDSEIDFGSIVARKLVAGDTIHAGAGASAAAANATTIRRRQRLKFGRAEADVAITGRDIHLGDLDD